MTLQYYSISHLSCFFIYFFVTKTLTNIYFIFPCFLFWYFIYVFLFHFQDAWWYSRWDKDWKAYGEGANLILSVLNDIFAAFSLLTAENLYIPTSFVLSSQLMSCHLNETESSDPFSTPSTSRKCGWALKIFICLCCIQRDRICFVVVYISGTCRFLVFLLNSLVFYLNWFEW